MQQIVINLVTNAIKFTPAGGQVVVCVPESRDFPALDAKTRLCVRDTGIGIPTDKHALIFDPFVQINQQLTRTAGGVGLGFAISRRLARDMGGDLTVQSAEGSGAEFVIELLMPSGLAMAAEESRP